MDLIRAVADLWHIPPVRWAVYLGIALAAAYVIAARAWRWVNADERVTLGEKIIMAPLLALLVVLSWAFNWAVATWLWWDSGPGWPRQWNETFTGRLQRTLDHPRLYPARAVWIARRLEPWMNRHHPGHLK